MRRKYVGAEKLDVTSHVHKTALHPFLLAVGRVLRDSLVEGGNLPTLEYDKDETPKRLKVRVTVKIDGEEKWAYSVLPLNFLLSLNDEVHDFSAELNEISLEKKTKSISKYVTKLAKRRNRILYATPEGIPSLSSKIDPFLIYRESVIYANLVLYLLIDPYKDHQLFVHQCLKAFLKVLPHVRGTSK